MKKFIILIISMMVTFSASSQVLDSIKRIATETAIEEEEKFVVDHAIGFHRKHSYRRCVERDGKLFYWRSDTMTQEDFELLDKYGMLYYAKDSIDYEMKLWEYLPNYHDDIEAAQYFFCTSNPKYYKRIIDIYPKTVKLRCRK